jgi:hypothetical protein
VKDESRKLFLKYGEKYQKAIKEENYIEAFVCYISWASGKRMKKMIVR